MLTGKNFSWNIRQEHFEDENFTKRTLNLIKTLLVFIKRRRGIGGISKSVE